MFSTQAIQAETKEDREIVCGEVFADVTGKLDEVAQGNRPAVPRHCSDEPTLSHSIFLEFAERLQEHRRCRYFELLAPYLDQVRTLQHA